MEQQIAGIYIIAADGTLAYVNPYFARVFGYEPAEIIGRPMLEFVARIGKGGSERTVCGADDRPRTIFRLQFDSFAQGRRAGRCSHPQQCGDFRRPTSLDRGDPRYQRGASEQKKRFREEEAKFRSLVEQNVAGIVIVRDDGTIGYCNGYFAHLVGYAPEEVVGRPLLDFVPETEQPIVARSLRSQLVETGAPVQIASTMRARDGSIVEVLVNASKAKFEGRSASIAVVVDVTERNRAQRKLASTAAILATEHESSPDGILVVDPKARIISVNRRFGRDL